jgi:hypothetical protein
LGINSKHMWIVGRVTPAAATKGTLRYTHLQVKCSGSKKPHRAKKEGERQVRTAFCDCHAWIDLIWILPTDGTTASTHCVVSAVNAVHCGHPDPREVAPNITSSTTINPEARDEIVKVLRQSGCKMGRKAAVHLAATLGGTGVKAKQVDYLRRVALKAEEEDIIGELVSDPTLFVKPSDVSTQSGSDSQKLFNTLVRYVLKGEEWGFKCIVEYGNVTLHALMGYPHTQIHTYTHVDTVKYKGTDMFLTCTHTKQSVCVCGVCAFQICIRNTTMYKHTHS